MAEPNTCKEYKRTTDSSVCTNCGKELDTHTAGAVNTPPPPTETPEPEKPKVMVLRMQNYRTRYTYDVTAQDNVNFELSIIEADPEHLATKVAEVMASNTKGLKNVNYKLKRMEVLE